MQDKETIPKNIASAEIGESGTLIFNGVITAEDYNKNLNHYAGIRIYEIMRRSDPTVHSALSVLKLPLLGTTWEIEAARDADGNIRPEDEYVAKYIEKQLFKSNINWQRFLKQALTCYDFGYSVFEKVFTVVEFEGKPMIGLLKLASRKQNTIYKWEQEDGQPGITQLINNGHKYNIPMEKLVIVSYDREGDNYEGTPILRYVYKDWDIKDKLTLVNAMANEKLGLGVPVISEKTGMTASSNDQSDAIDALSNLRANEQSYLKIPQTMMVEMLDLKGNSTKDILPTIQYHDGRIMTGVLARFMELGGSSGSGSQALSRDLSSFFMKAEEAMANELCAIVNEQIIQQLCDFNFSNLPNGYPSLKFGAIADDDTTSLAAGVAQLMSAGALTPDTDLEDNLRARLRLPELSEETKAKIATKDQMAEAATAGLQDLASKTENGATPPTPEDVKAAINAARDYRNLLIGIAQD